MRNIDFAKLRSIKANADKPYLRDNGQYIKPGVATPNDTISREIKRLKIQEDFFEKTLALCKQHNIKTFLVLLPTRENELKSYTEDQLAEFDGYLQKQTDGNNITLLNYSRFEGFSVGDYTDITHFNRQAADRFSEILSDTIFGKSKR